MADEKSEGLKQFIKEIVTEAYYLANEGRTMDGFESTLIERISEKYHVPLRSVSKVYGPFHWSFFDGKAVGSSNSDLSPIKMVPYGDCRLNPAILSAYQVGPKEEYLPWSLDSFIQAVQEKYGSTILNRLDIQLQDRLGVHRQAI